MPIEEETSAIIAILLAGLVMLAAFVLLATPAAAERPFRTDEPYTVGQYQWKTSAGLAVGSGSWEGVAGRSQADFELAGDYGITPNMEVGAEAVMYRVNDPGADGFGRIDAHFKHNFTTATPEWPDMGYDVRIRIPSGRRVDPRSDGKPELGIAYLLGWRGDRWTTTARIGAVQTSSAILDNRYELGVAGRYLVAPQTRLLGEFWYDSNEKPGQNSRMEFSAGMAYLASHNFILDLMLTAGTTESVPDITVRAGVTSRL